MSKCDGPTLRTCKRSALEVLTKRALSAVGRSGRAAIFYRDPDMNTLECVELPMWR